MVEAYVILIASFIVGNALWWYIWIVANRRAHSYARIADGWAKAAVDQSANWRGAKRELGAMAKGNTLEALEAAIAAHYIEQGYKLEKDQTANDKKWGFVILIKTAYKLKEIKIVFQEDGEDDDILTIRRDTVQEMIAAAIKYYPVKGGDKEEEHF